MFCFLELPKPKVVVCPEKEVIVYVWDGKVKPQEIVSDVKAVKGLNKPIGDWISVGHLAMELPKFNKYISFWPNGGDASDQLLKGSYVWHSVL